MTYLDIRILALSFDVRRRRLLVALPLSARAKLAAKTHPLSLSPPAECTVRLKVITHIVRLCSVVPQEYIVGSSTAGRLSPQTLGCRPASSPTLVISHPIHAILSLIMRRLSAHCVDGFRSVCSSCPRPLAEGAERCPAVGAGPRALGAVSARSELSAGNQRKKMRWRDHRCLISCDRCVQVEAFHRFIGVVMKVLLAPVQAHTLAFSPRITVCVVDI